MIWIAGIDHLCDWSSETDLDTDFGELSFGDSGSPPDLCIPEPFRAIVIIGIDGYLFDPTAEQYRHERVTRFVIGRQFRHDLMATYRWEANCSAYSTAQMLTIDARLARSASSRYW